MGQRDVYCNQQLQGSPSCCAADSGGAERLPGVDLIEPNSLAEHMSRELSLVDGERDTAYKSCLSLVSENL